MRRLLPVLLLAATLLGAGTADAARPAAPSLRATTTVTGTAGGLVDVVLPRDVMVEGEFAGLTADRGSFVGVVLVSPAGEHRLQQVQGVPAPCAFAAGCTSDSVGDGVEGTDLQDGSYRLRAGTYTLALLGEPGARVTATLRFGGLPGRAAAVRTTRSGALRVTAVPSEVPSLPDTQPYAKGRVTLPGPNGRTFTGAVLRFDVQAAKDLAYDLCFYGAGPQLPVGCASFDYTVTGGVSMGTCVVPVPVCVPLIPEAQAFTIAHGTVVHHAPSLAYTATVKAVRSRVEVVAFALSLGS